MASTASPDLRLGGGRGYSTPDGLLALYRDRLFRSVADAANVIDEFDKKGIQLVSIGEGFDMTHAYGRAMAQMASVFAELERAIIRERTRSAMSVKRSRGERISGHAPYGWDFGRGGRLVENVSKSTSAAVSVQLDPKRSIK